MSQNSSKKKKKEQLYLDVGQRSSNLVHCLHCGMSYLKGNDDDVKIHKNFCKKKKILKISKGRLKSFVVLERFGSSLEYKIIKIMQNSKSKKEQHLFNDLLDHVDAALGFIQRKDSPSNEVKGNSNENVFSQGNSQGISIGLSQSQSQSQSSQSQEEKEMKDDDFKKEENFQCYACVYNGVHVVGLVFAEEKKKCYVTLENKMEYEKNLGDRCLLGISRIWVEKNHRRKKVATNLVEVARKNFFYGFHVGEKNVAFSHPTSDGWNFGKTFTNSNSIKIY